MAYNKDIVVFKVSNYVFGVQKTNVVISFQDSGQNVKNVILGFIVKGVRMVNLWRKIPGQSRGTTACI